MSRALLVVALLLAISAGQAAAATRLRARSTSVSLRARNSPLTVKILSSGGLVSGGVKPWNTTYLTPLPITSTVRTRILAQMAATPSQRAIVPWAPGFAYPFSTQLTPAGDAVLTLDPNFYIPSRWWRWYSLIPWPIGYTVKDAANATAGGAIAVFIRQ